MPPITGRAHPNEDQHPGVTARGRLDTLLLARGDTDRLRFVPNPGRSSFYADALFAKRDVAGLEREVHAGSAEAVELLLLLRTGLPAWSGRFELDHQVRPVGLPAIDRHTD